MRYRFASSPDSVPSSAIFVARRRNPRVNSSPRTTPPRATPPVRTRLRASCPPPSASRSPIRPRTSRRETPPLRVARSRRARAPSSSSGSSPPRSWDFSHTVRANAFGRARATSVSVSDGSSSSSPSSPFASRASSPPPPMPPAGTERTPYCTKKITIISDTPKPLSTPYIIHESPHIVPFVRKPTHASSPHPRLASPRRLDVAPLPAARSRSIATSLGRHGQGARETSRNCSHRMYSLALSPARRPRVDTRERVDGITARMIANPSVPSAD